MSLILFNNVFILHLLILDFPDIWFEKFTVILIYFDSYFYFLGFCLLMLLFFLYFDHSLQIINEVNVFHFFAFVCCNCYYFYLLLLLCYLSLSGIAWMFCKTINLRVPVKTWLVIDVLIVRVTCWGLRQRISWELA